MNKAQLQKAELEKKYQSLELEYEEFDRKINALDKNLIDHLLPSVLCATGLGIPIIIEGLREDFSLYLIIGGCIMSLCLMFGIKAYKNNSEIEESQYILRKEQYYIAEKMKDVKDKINNIKTIKIILADFEKKKIDDWYNAYLRTLDNCFYTLLNLFNEEEKSLIKNYSEYINNYSEDSDKLQNIIRKLDESDFISYGRIDNWERIENEKILVEKIIYEYIICVKEIFKIIIDEDYENDFIKNGKLTHNGIIAKNILEKLSLIETEYAI